MTRRTFLRLIFEDGFDEAEAQIRGYRSHVWVEVGDGSRYCVTFYDMFRLTQTLQDECRSGRHFFTEPGLIVVHDVTLANMEAAARALAAEGFFEKHVAPGTPDDASR